MINIVDKFNKKKAVRSPVMKTNTSTAINKTPMYQISKVFLFFLMTNNANKSGNKRVKYDPKINSLPNKDEILLFSNGERPKKFT